MWEAAAIVLIVAGGFFWIDSLRARERALAGGADPADESHGPGDARRYGRLCLASALETGA